MAIVKQGQGEVAFQYQVKVVLELIALGSQPPYTSGSKGSFALLGYKRAAGEVIAWTQQVANIEGRGISEIRANVPLFGEQCTASCCYYRNLQGVFISLQNTVDLDVVPFSISPIPP